MRTLGQIARMIPKFENVQDFEFLISSALGGLDALIFSLVCQLPAILNDFKHVVVCVFLLINSGGLKPTDGDVSDEAR